jgi:hypothetical protein
MTGPRQTCHDDDQEERAGRRGASSHRVAEHEHRECACKNRHSQPVVIFEAVQMLQGI